MNIGILLFDEVEVLDFCGPFEVFSVAAKIGAASGGDPLFTVFTLAEHAGLVQAAGGLKVQPDYTINDHPPLDLLLVPGGMVLHLVARLQGEDLAQQTARQMEYIPAAER